MYQIKTNGKVFTTVQTKAQVKTITATLRSMKIKYSTKILTSLLLILISLSTFANGSTHHNRGHKAKRMKASYFCAKHFCNNYLKM